MHELFSLSRTCFILRDESLICWHMFGYLDIECLSVEKLFVGFCLFLHRLENYLGVSFQFLQNVENELDVLRLEEADLMRRLDSAQCVDGMSQKLANGHGSNNDEALKVRLDDISKNKKELG